jgi:hypothetical protein
MLHNYAYMVTFTALAKFGISAMKSGWAWQSFVQQETYPMVIFYRSLSS